MSTKAKYAYRHLRPVLHFFAFVAHYAVCTVTATMELDYSDLITVTHYDS